MKEYTTTAVFDKERKYFKHFGIRPKIASIWGSKPEDIVDVIMTIAEDQTIPTIGEMKHLSPDYWGWMNNGEEEFSSMIFPSRLSLETCFPAGIEKSESYGMGKAYRLDIAMKS